MNRLIENILVRVLMALATILIVLSLQFIVSQDKWSPIDEYAHMDYIEKLGAGNIPRLSDTISSEIFEHIRNNPDKTVDGKHIHTRADIGFGNNSYQAKHPPLYYMILVLPNLILKKAGIAIFDRLIALRIITYLLFILGSYLCIPIFNTLRQLQFNIPRFYGWMCFCFSLLICTHERYGLGNNLLSPLLVNGAVIFMLRYQITFDKKYLLFFLFLCCLSVFAALSNILIAPFLILFVLYKNYRRLFSKTILMFVIILGLSSLLFVLWLQASAPDKDFEIRMNKVLAFNTPPGVLSFAGCLHILLNDTFELSFIKKELNVSSTFILLLICNLVFSAVYLPRMWNKHAWLIVAYILFVIFVLEFYTLNQYVGVVTWMAFRHYLGFIPIFFISMSGGLVFIKHRSERHHT